MLNFLREKSNSTFVKIIIGLSALALVILFSTSQDYDSRGGSEALPIGSINGEPVSGRYFHFLSSQIMPKTGDTDKMPDFVLKYYQQMSLEQVTRFYLTKQFLKSSGLWASAEEQADMIKKMERYQRDGRFSKEAFDEDNPERESIELKGVPFADFMRHDIGIQKIATSAENIFHVNEITLKKQFELSETKYDYEIIEIAKEEVTAPEKENGEQEKPQEDKKQPQKLTSEENAKKILAAWKSGKDITSILKEAGLEKQSKEGLVVSDLKNLFGGKDDVELFKKVLALQTKGFLDEPLLIGQTFYLVHLKSQTAAPQQNFDKKKDAIAQSYKENLVNTLLRAFTEDLRNKSKITLSP